jgi:hypothetical protein
MMWISNVDEVHQPLLDQSKSPVTVHHVFGDIPDILSQTPLTQIGAENEDDPPAQQMRGDQFVHVAHIIRHDLNPLLTEEYPEPVLARETVLTRRSRRIDEIPAVTRTSHEQGLTQVRGHTVAFKVIMVELGVQAAGQVAAERPAHPGAGLNCDNQWDSRSRPAPLTWVISVSVWQGMIAGRVVASVLRRPRRAHDLRPSQPTHPAADLSHKRIKPHQASTSSGWPDQRVRTGRMKPLHTIG